MQVAKAYPYKHMTHVVRRDGVIYTCTVCYGLHEPWWIVKTMEGEVPPIPIQSDDEWWPISLVMEKLNEAV